MSNVQHPDLSTSRPDDFVPLFPSPATAEASEGELDLSLDTLLLFSSDAVLQINNFELSHLRGCSVPATRQSFRNAMPMRLTKIVLSVAVAFKNGKLKQLFETVRTNLLSTLARVDPASRPKAGADFNFMVFIMKSLPALMREVRTKIGGLAHLEKLFMQKIPSLIHLLAKRRVDIAGRKGAQPTHRHSHSGQLLPLNTRSAQAARHMKVRAWLGRRSVPRTAATQSSAQAGGSQEIPTVLRPRPGANRVQRSSAASTIVRRST